MEITYKGCLIVKAEHPMLSGKYEVFNRNDEFLRRGYTIKDCKDLINEHLKI